MKIVSFDPASFRNLGWSVIDTDAVSGLSKINDTRSGTFVLASYSSPWMCLYPLFKMVDKFLKKEKPDLVIIESTSSFGGFVGGQVANCTGAILSCCGKHSLDVKFVYPTHVKKVITGKGKATKSVMKKSTNCLLLKFYGSETKFNSEHACDACANILCWLIDNKYLNTEVKLCP